MSRLLLLLALTVLAAGPLLATALPAGPAGVFTPASVAAAASAAVLLFLIFAWPALARERRPGRVLGEGAEILGLTLPIVLVLARAAGATRPEAANVLAVLGGAAAVTGLWLSGPGAGRERDRWFVAAALTLTVALPFANYALNEFGVTEGELGYRLSPLLVPRAILLGEAGADALPCLLLMLGIAALLSGLRAVRGAGSAGLLVLILALPARADELEPLFGSLYVPGRPVPLRVDATGEVVEVRVGSGADFTDVVLGPDRGDWLEVPGRESLGEVRLRSGTGEVILDCGVRAVLPGTWLVAVGPSPPGLLRAAEERGFQVSRAAVGAEGVSDEAWLSVDGVIDVGERLDPERAERLRGAGIPVIRRVEELPGEAPLPRGTRRPWEEPGNILDPAGLPDLFPPPAVAGSGEARTAFLVCLGWAVVAGALLRWGRARRWGRWILLGLAGALILADLLVVVSDGPPPTGQTFRVVEGARVTEITRFRGARLGGWGGARGDALPQPMFGGAVIDAGRTYRLAFRLEPHESRILVRTRFAPGPAPERDPTLLIGPLGLATPGEEWVPAGEYLRRLRPGDRARATAIRKLLRAGDLPGRVYEVAFFDGGMDVRPAR